MDRIFVGGLPPDFDEIELAKLFSPIANIKTIHIFRNQKGDSHCYAFVQLMDNKNIEKAITELDSLLIGKYVLRVKMAGDKSEKAQKYERLEDEPRAAKYIKVEKPTKNTRMKRPRKIFGPDKSSNRE